MKQFGKAGNGEKDDLFKSVFTLQEILRAIQNALLFLKHHTDANEQGLCGISHLSPVNRKVT
jgi:hypothetical protein